MDKSENENWMNSTEYWKNAVKKKDNERNFQENLEKCVSDVLDQTTVINQFQFYAHRNSIILPSIVARQSRWILVNLRFNIIVFSEVAEIALFAARSRILL